MKKIIIVILSIQLGMLDAFAKIAQYPLRSHNEEVQTLLNDFKDLKGAYRFVSVLTKDQAFEKEWLRFFAQKGFNSERAWPQSTLENGAIAIEGLQQPVFFGSQTNEFVYRGKSFIFDPKKSPEANFIKIQEAWGEFSELESSRQESRFFIEFSWLPVAKADVGPLYMAILGTLGVYAVLITAGVTVIGVGSWYAYKKLYKEPKEINEALKNNHSLPAKAFCQDKIVGFEKGNLKYLLEPDEKQTDIQKIYVQQSFRKYFEMQFKISKQKDGNEVVENVQAPHEFWIFSNGQLTEIFQLVLKMREVCKSAQQDTFNAVSSRFFDEKNNGHMKLYSDNPEWTPMFGGAGRLPASK